MESVISIDDYVNRSKEVFDTYIKNNAKETSLLPLLEKYANEDNYEYETNDILRYLKLYIKSNLISESEKLAFINSRKVSNELIFKRGKIITLALIESQGDLLELTKYGITFANQDGKFKPYSNNYLLKCRDYYLDNTKNTNIINTYNTIMKLSKRGEYDVELLNKLLEIESNDDALKFIDDINISKLTFKSLVDEYKILYPANSAQINRLNNIVKELNKRNEKVVKFIDLKRKKETLSDRLLNLRRILEDYLISDIKNISELYPKYNFNKFKFNETLKDAKTGTDLILKSLIDKYNAKCASVNEYMKGIIEKIIQAHEEGINYGNGYREFNLYDFYLLCDDNKRKDLLMYAKNIYEKSDYNKISLVFKSYEEEKIYVSKKELATELKLNSDIDSDVIIDIINYIEYINMPLSKELFLSVYTRINDKDIEYTNKSKVA